MSAADEEAFLQGTRICVSDSQETSARFERFADDIRRLKQRTSEVFMPLAHPPGEAQFGVGSTWPSPGA